MANSGFDSASRREEGRAEESPWPRRAPFALVPTHDVDRIQKTYQYVTHLRRREGWRRLPSLFRGENPYWNFDRILDLERSVGVRSTFFFLQESRGFRALHPREWTTALGKYRFDSRPVAEAIGTLDRQGWEVGLHGSYDSFRHQGLLESERRALEDVLGHEVEGVRQHYLNLEIPETWKRQRGAGFRYDSSLGRKDQVGLDGIPSFPVSPFDDDFLVLPLAITDGALFFACGTADRARARVTEILDTATREHALVVVLWHQRFLNPQEFPEQFGLYKFVLEEGVRRHAWIAPAGEVASWWRDRGLASR